MTALGGGSGSGGGDAAAQHQALAAAFTRLGVDGGDGTSALASSLAPLMGSYGARLPGRGMTLATSFREPSCLPLPAAIVEEAAGLDDNSDEEWEARRARGVGGARRGAGGAAEGAAGGSGSQRGGAGAGQEEDSSDDEAPGGGGGVGGELGDDGCVFGQEHF